MSIRRIGWLAAVVAFLFGCGSNTGPPKLTTGLLIVTATDAPFPIDSVQSVNLLIVRVDMKQTASADAEYADATTPPGSDPSHGWISAVTPNTSIDLVPLHGGATASLTSAKVATGTYRSIRLVLDTDRSSVTLKNGRVLTGTSNPSIQWPSAGRSGVKVTLAT